MEEKLTRLYNTMMCIETKGESTKLMAQCLNYVQALVAEARLPEKIPEPVSEAGE